MTVALSRRARWRRRGLLLLGMLPWPVRRPTPLRRLALFRPDHLGDLILAAPAIERLRLALPAAEVHLWVGPWAEPLAKGIAGVTVRTLPFPGFERAPKRSALAPYRLLVAEAARLRAERYDAVVLLRFDHWWGALLSRLAGIPLRLGYAQPDAAPFLTHRVRYRPGRHETLQNSRLIDHLIRLAGGTPPAQPPGRPRIVFPDEAPPDGLPARFVVLHPGAGSPVKRWRPDGYAAVARWLADRGFALLVSGSERERILVEETVAAMPVPARALIGLPLPALAATLRRATLALGPDSGIMHLASAVGTPTVRLYGPVDHRAFGPWADPASVVVASSFLCAPCNRLDWQERDLPAHPCVFDLPVSRVIAAVEQALLVAVP
ncbi:MAG: glycosyltransferase family 9 protein [Chloroflexota bacterium]|nr:glycosyltransferase family 9 protein [Dehalococcoidia bacterium]MDW8252899.1 glycosyltransferase family 9 protein [Chloroflexota bacterium]